MFVIYRKEVFDGFFAGEFLFVVFYMVFFTLSFIVFFLGFMFVWICTVLVVVGIFCVVCRDLIFVGFLVLVGFFFGFNFFLKCQVQDGRLVCKQVFFGFFRFQIEEFSKSRSSFFFWRVFICLRIGFCFRFGRWGCEFLLYLWVYKGGIFRVYYFGFLFYIVLFFYFLVGKWVGEYCVFGYEFKFSLVFGLLVMVGVLILVGQEGVGYMVSLQLGVVIRVFQISRMVVGSLEC